MKQCKECGEEKPLDEFYRHNKMKDGRLNKCKTCTKRDVRANRKANIEYYREYDRQRGNRQGPEYVRKYRSDNARKYAATNAVNNAVRDGRLVKPDQCSECGSGGRIHGHHDDYAKPLEVRWLCAPCHRAWHDEHGEGANP